MSELYRRLSLADRREQAKRQRDRDIELHGAVKAERLDLVRRFRDRLDSKGGSEA